MRKNTFIALAVVAAGSMLTVQAIAQSRGQGQRADPTERLMQMDANSDGKLSRDELPERFAERIFSADADGDGFLTKAELQKHFESAEAGQGRGGLGGGTAQDRGSRGADQDRGGRGTASGEAPFGRHMAGMNRALRQLSRSDMSKGSMEDDLQAVSGLQASVLGAKSTIQQIPMSAKARAQFGEDQAAYRHAFRSTLNRTMLQTVELEAAILAQDSQKAGRIITALKEMQDKGHDFFQSDEDDVAPEPRPRRGGQGGFGAGDDKDKDKDKDKGPRGTRGGK